MVVVCRVDHRHRAACWPGWRPNCSKDQFHQPATIGRRTTLLLKEMVLTHTNYNYAHNHKGLFLRLVEPILPNFVLQKLPPSSGSFGFGSDGVQTFTSLL